LKNKILSVSILSALFGLVLLAPLATVSASPDWTLNVTSLSGNTISLTYNDLSAMPKTNVDAELYCYGNLVTSGNWGGVQLGLLIQQVGVDPEGGSIDFAASDGYRVNIPIEWAARSDVIVAYEKDGAPLTENLRLVVPDANGNVWIAQITTITLASAATQTQGATSGGGSTGAERLETGLRDLEKSLEQSQTPVAPKNESIAQPNEPPVAVTQPAVQPDSQPSEDSGFSAEIGYGIAFAATALLAVTAGFLIYKRKNASLKLKQN
jgi:DMSO/TMAO reductase YedYZ molybdopterin-dependent catalytic subunit